MEKELRLLDRIHGTIYGLAIGDALGYPVEFMKLPQIREKYGERGIIRFPSDDGGNTIGNYSDDTQMTLAVANALLDSNSEDSDEIMKNMSNRFIEWANSPENNRAPGLTCMGGINRLEQGFDWKESGLDSYGCGAAMRVAPIGISYHDDPEKLKEIAKNSAVITHNHPIAIASAIGNAYLISRGLNGEDPTDLDSLLRFTEGISPEFNKKIKKIDKYINLDPDEALNRIGGGWVAHEALASALYCAKKCDMDFERTIIMGANTNGDSDSIASIAGGIVGSYIGLEDMPRRFMRGLENRDLLHETGYKLYKKLPLSSN